MLKIIFISHASYLLLSAIYTFYPYDLKIHSMHLRERFPLRVKINRKFPWFRFTLICDWPRKLAPFSQSIKFKTRTNRVLIIRVLPHFGKFACFFMSSHRLLVIFLSDLIGRISTTFVLVLRHSIESALSWRLSWHIVLWLQGSEP